MNNLSIYPLTLDGNSVEKKRQEIIEYFRNSWELYEKVFELLKDETVFYKKSELTRHPMIFYFGHTATFFINKLINMNIIDYRIDANFESIFAVGVDEMAWDDIEDSSYEWPKVSEVRKYRSKIKKLVEELIMNLPLTLPITQDSSMWIILMGIEHERIHIETSLVLHTQMPLELIKEVEEFTTCTELGDAPNNELVSIKAQHVKLGKDIDDNLYGWDNEYGSYEENVEAFKVSKYLVSNGEYLEFVKDDGYKCDRYWDEEGLRFLESSKQKYPAFWVVDDVEFRYRTLSNIIDLPLNFPVEVNALEAEAFCRYKSEKDDLNYSLPSEVEYRAIYNHAKIEDIPKSDFVNLNFNQYSSVSPVDKFSHNGIYDVVGNVWQWSRTPIFGFDGFKVHKAYDDFSTPTFDDKHALILGSSWASSGNLIMKHSRYAFRKHFVQFSGFRYVVSNSSSEKQKNMILKDKEVEQNIQLQYNTNFSLKCAKIALRFADKKSKALDLGCGVGRISFELSSEFEKVDGIEVSARFIKVAIENQLKNLDNRVSFHQGDARNLKSNFNSYDLIIMNDLRQRFYEPTLLLNDVENRLNSGAILVLILPDDYKLAKNLIKNFTSLHVENIEDYIVSVWRKNEL